jgi:hypothetical protein
LCRAPTAEELDLCTKFLAGKPSPSWVRLVHGLMNHYEFRTLR